MMSWGQVCEQVTGQVWGTNCVQETMCDRTESSQVTMTNTGRWDPDGDPVDLHHSSKLLQSVGSSLRQEVMDENLTSRNRASLNERVQRLCKRRKRFFTPRCRRLCHITLLTMQAASVQRKKCQSGKWNNLVQTETLHHYNMDYWNIYSWSHLSWARHSAVLMLWCCLGTKKQLVRVRKAS